MLAYLINTYALENGVGALCPAAGGTWGAGGGTEIVVRDRKSSGDSARVEVAGLKVLFVLLQVSTVSEMKSYSQAVTGVRTPLGVGAALCGMWSPCGEGEGS